jgi:DNA repair protein RadC
LRHPDTIKHYLKLHLAAKPHEVFAVLFLDVQNRLLAMEETVSGARLTQTSVYPREVVLRALHHQASCRGAGPQPPQWHRATLAGRRNR